MASHSGMTVPVGRNAGFTLIELMVVLAIIALGMTALPSVMVGLPGVRLQSAADDTVTRLRLLHSQALRRGMVTEWHLDPATRTYWSTDAAAPAQFSSAVASVAFEATFPNRDDTAVIRFYPDGSARGGILRLNNGTHSARVVIDWLTGQVHRGD